MAAALNLNSALQDADLITRVKIVSVTDAPAGSGFKHVARATITDAAKGPQPGESIELLSDNGFICPNVHRQRPPRMPADSTLPPLLLRNLADAEVEVTWSGGEPLARASHHQGNRGLVGVAHLRGCPPYPSPAPVHHRRPRLRWPGTVPRRIHRHLQTRRSLTRPG